MTYCLKRKDYPLVKHFSKLGANQKAVLRLLLKSPEKRWEHGVSNEYWRSPKATMEILQSLVKYHIVLPNGTKGYVEWSVGEKVWWWSIEF